MVPKSLDLTYARLMKCHPFGTALYNPPSSSQFRVGGVGYFDSSGAWNPISDVSTSSNPLSPIEASQLAKAPREEQIWGPKLGTSTDGHELGVSTGIGALPLVAATAGTAPIDISAQWSFQSSSRDGAILLTSGPVVHDRYYHREPFLQWMRLNADQLRKLYPEVKEHGVWVVTSTWTAKEAAINCWNDSGKAVKVGFALKALEIGEVAPKGRWVHQGFAAGWISPQANQVRQLGKDSVNNCTG